MTREEYMERLTEISYRKYRLLREMLDLTEAQSRSINENGLEELEKLVQEKQVRIDAIKESTGRIVELIQRISAIEKDNHEKARALLNVFGEELRRINQGKKANSAYMPEPPVPPSYFIDKKK